LSKFWLFCFFLVHQYKHDAQLQHKLQTHIKKVAFSEIWIPPPNTHLSLHAQQSDLIH